MKQWLIRALKYDRLIKSLESLDVKANVIIQNQREILMSQKYHDTVADYEWLKYKSISPGGWAVNYSFCYTLARVLNTMRPHCILECGLGQSSRIVHQYSSFFNVNAITCEHDDNWMKFMREEIGGHYPINIKQVEIEYVEYNGYKTLSYKGLNELFNGERFDLVVIDGPFGSPHYSRPQVIDLCKNNLANRFCVIIDDTERVGEKETVEEIKNVFLTNRIEYAMVEYSSDKSHTLLCSKDLEFLTSM